MTEFTQRVIHDLKIRVYEEHETMTQKLAHIIAKIREFPYEEVKDDYEFLYNESVNLLTDYLKTADNPSFVIWDMFDGMKRSYNYRQFSNDSEPSYYKMMSEGILIELMLAQVREDGKFINGFTSYIDSLA